MAPASCATIRSSRTTCAGSLAVRTAPLSDVQAWMGHQDISTTMRYVHYVPPARRGAKLTAAFAPDPVSRTMARHAELGPQMSETENADMALQSQMRRVRALSHRPGRRRAAGPLEERARLARSRRLPGRPPGGRGGQPEGAAKHVWLGNTTRTRRAAGSRYKWDLIGTLELILDDEIPANARISKVGDTGLEPVTSALSRRRSPS